MYCWSIKKRLEMKLISFDNSVQEYKGIFQQEKRGQGKDFECKYGGCAKILNVSMAAVLRF